MAPLLLLGATVAALVMGHRHVRPLVVIAVAIGVGTATRIIPIGDVAQSLGPLVEPLAFLTAAVPLSMLLDRIGFFDAAAERVAAHHRLRPSLWVFAAAVTTLFNLDTAIVLLTPLYIRIARRHGLDPLTTAFQPVLLASLASSALPVSNLTNLIVASSTGVGVGDFLVRLAPASIIASTVGWWAFRRTSLRGREPVVIEEPGTPRSRDALRVGVPVVLFLVVGFTAGAAVGLPAWAVASVGALVMIAVTRHIPWRSLPVDAIAVAGGLALLAAATVDHLPLREVLGGEGPGAAVRTLAAGVLGANVMNNLPALLVGLPFVEPGALWSFLAGVNFGPILWIHGSLAGLLWLDIVRGHGLEITPISYARVSVRVGLPALLAVSVVIVGTAGVIAAS